MQSCASRRPPHDYPPHLLVRPGQPLQMKTAKGTIVYSCPVAPVEAHGIKFTDSELHSALADRVAPLLRDDVGRLEIEELVGGLAKTSFAADHLRAALERPHVVKDWQVGEGLAEVYLSDHHECEFPWPTMRDLRNPNASPAGADLVGFQTHAKSVRFAFGEVKTSEEEKWPPQVVTSRHGLAKQIEELRDSSVIKGHLALIYMAHRARNSEWESKYKTATARYLSDPNDVSLFGFLIRDVSPKEADLESRAVLLAKNCPKGTSIELRALYLSPKKIGSLAKSLRPKKATK